MDEMLLLAAPPLGRTAAVVRHGRDVLDGRHLDAGALYRANGGVTPRTRALHLHLGASQAVLLGGLGRPLGGQLGGERRRLAGALEPHAARRRPRDDVALGVGDRDDRVVERALDVHHAGGDVLAVPAARAATRWLRLGHRLLPHGLLLVGDGALRPLAGPGVGVRALTTDRQALAVPHALEAPD